jgi:ribosomal protein L37E
MENIIIRGFNQCQRCGEYAPYSDFTIRNYMCDSCVHDEEEEDNARYEWQESVRIGETIF